MIYILYYLNTHKTGPNRSRTSSRKLPKPQDRGLNFPRTAKTGTAVFAGLVPVPVWSRSYLVPQTGP